MQVLFIDDDPEDVEIFSAVVQDIIPEAVCSALYTCSDIETIWNTLEELDVIFLDAHMQPVSGKECLIKLKELIDPQITRVIILTGSISQTEEHEFLGLGVAAVICKGTSYEEMKSTLYHAISGNNQQSA